LSEVSSRDLRIAERYLLAPPVDAIFGAEPVCISDLSTSGVRLSHKSPLESGSKSMLRFRPEGCPSDFTLQGEVVWTQLSSAVDPDEKYVSGVRTYGERSVVDSAISKLDDSGRLFRVEERRGSDRFLIGTPLKAEFAPVGAVRLCDIAGKGARIETTSCLKPGTKGDLHFSLASGTLDVNVEAEVAWCRLKAIYSANDNRYHVGLRITAKSEFMRLAIGQLRELKKATKDTHSLKLKFKISRARSRNKTATPPEAAPTSETSEYFSLIDVVRSELRSNLEEGARWRLLAKLSSSKPELRGIAGPITDDLEALSVWEYLERTVDPSIVSLAFHR